MPSDVRAAAAWVLAKLSQQQGSLATLLPMAQSRVLERDHALLQALCYGVCRYWFSLHAAKGQWLQKPLRAKDADITALLLLGLFQLQYLRVPDHAAINATVQAAKILKKNWAAGLLNGVLRQAQRALKEQEQAVVTLAGSQEHPDWLRGMLNKHWPQHAEAIFLANMQPAPMSLRVNQRRVTREAYLQQLQAANLPAVPSAINEVGIVLQTPTDVTMLPGFADGDVSVQDVHAQLAADLLDPAAGMRVLDACAAPGGKTAHILEKADCELLALDIEPERAALIEQGLQRLQLMTGEHPVQVAAADAADVTSWWDGNSYDRILLDAPCSATGVIRRHPDIKLTRRADDIAVLAGIQANLLQQLWPCLAVGGRLVYATCSVLRHENSKVIEAFMQQYADAKLLEAPLLERLQLAASNVVLNTQFGYQLLPNTMVGQDAGERIGGNASANGNDDVNGTGGDGFFYAVIEKLSL